MSSAAASSTSAPSERALLASARWETTVDLATVGCDRAKRGAVSRRGPASVVRRAEPGSHGPLLLQVQSHPQHTDVTVAGSPRTAREDAERALEDAAGWAGLRDDPSPLSEFAASDRRVWMLVQAVGCPRLGRLPRVTEAVGRAVPAQLVQRAEAHRSIAQLATAVGTPAGDLTTWPSAATIRSTPDWTFRRCGISARGARSLRAAAVEEPRLRRAVGDWRQFDARLGELPGVGAWTSAEVRTALGDADAVSVGDYNLPGLLGHVLAGDRDADDAAMLDLLAPFAGHRGRVVQLVQVAVARRVVAPPQRRAPRAALSQHRYW